MISLWNKQHNKKTAPKITIIKYSNVCRFLICMIVINTYDLYVINNELINIMRILQLFVYANVGIHVYEIYDPSMLSLTA